MKVKDFEIKWHENDALSISVIVEELREEPFDLQTSGHKGSTVPHGSR